jgi:orotate phosphoribosyltransferase
VTHDELARRVAERAVLHGDFTLRSGRRSSVYLDKYRFETDPALLGPIGERLAEHVRELAPDRLGAPELGAVPLATAASLATGVPFVIVRKAAKEHGTEGRVEGLYESGEKIVVIEDVVTSGGALIAAVESLRSLGIVVEQAICVLDREEGGRESLAALGVELRSLFARSALGM